MTLRCDLILRDATIFDGTGAARTRGDVAVTGDRIVAVGDLGAMTADREVVATGKAVAPGFIDAHTHDDRAVLCGPECMLCKMSQGVATVVVGNCGISLSPVRMKQRPVPPLDLLGDESWWTFGSFGEYADRLARDPAPVNTVALIGHMSLRVEAMNGDTQRPASDAEAAQMEKRLAECLAEGASGFSTGLYYPPNIMAPTSEVIAVAQALRDAGGIYVSHMRDEAAHVLDSINETVQIGEASGVPVVISHHKCSMPENFGRSVETLALIERLAAKHKVDFDIYPYYAGSTVLMADRVRPDVPVKIAWSVPHPEMEGRMLADIAMQWNLGLKEAAERLLPAGAILFQMDETDVQRIMKHPLSMIGSDGLPHDKFPHPRLWGCFPRVLGHYSRELNLFSMETAVHKMTGRVAEVFGLVDRGVIRPGAYADLVLFDPATVKDAADFDHPTRPAIGILETWVNGQSAYVHGQGATEGLAAHGGGTGRVARCRRPPRAPGGAGRHPRVGGAAGCRFPHAAGMLQPAATGTAYPSGVAAAGREYRRLYVLRAVGLRVVVWLCGPAGHDGRAQPGGEALSPAGDPHRDLLGVHAGAGLGRPDREPGGRRDRAPGGLAGFIP